MASEPFNLDQMSVIATVNQEGSFSRAAAKLGVTQSAVSQSVRAIETALGRQLLVRSSRGLSVTSDGEAYLVYAHAMMKLGSEARRHFAGASVAGTIRLGLTEDFARTVLPSVLALFSRDYPDFAFDVESGFSTALFSGLEDGRFDAVIAKQPKGRTNGERLWTEPLVWFGRFDTPHPVPDPVDLALMPHPSQTRAAVLEALRRAGRPWRSRFQSLSFVTLEATVMAGVGVTAFGRRMHGPGLVELQEDAGLPPIDPVEMVMDQAKQDRAPATDAFCNLVREAAIIGSSRSEAGSEQN